MRLTTHERITHMSELVISQLELLRRQATAREENKSVQVTADQVAARIIAFMSDKDSVGYEAVENLFPAKYTHSAIVSRFDKVINDLQLRELVKVTRSDGHVMLVKMYDDPVETDDDDDDTDIGVEIEA